MRYKSLVVASILLAATAYAKEPKAYQSGKVLQMDSVQCGMDEKDAKSITGEIIGTDSGHKKTVELLCQEVLQSYEHGLKLIQQNTGRNEFTLGQEIVDNPKEELEKMVKESYNH